MGGKKARAGADFVMMESFRGSVFRGAQAARGLRSALLASPPCGRSQVGDVQAPLRLRSRLFASPPCGRPGPQDKSIGGILDERGVGLAAKGCAAALPEAGKLHGALERHQRESASR